MYCPTCRQERLGNSPSCSACGSAMYVRPRQLVEEELTHVDFLLAESWKWDATVVPGSVRRTLSARYEKQARVLTSALGKRAPEQPASPPERTAEALQPTLLLHCSNCELQRLGYDPVCVSCGSAMHPRPRYLVEEDLAHVQFLLEEMERWDEKVCAGRVRAYLQKRYERRANSLRTALSSLRETPGATPEPPAAAPPEPSFSIEEATAPADAQEEPPPAGDPDAQLDWTQAPSDSQAHADQAQAPYHQDPQAAYPGQAPSYYNPQAYPPQAQAPYPGPPAYGAPYYQPPYYGLPAYGAPFHLPPYYAPPYAYGAQAPYYPPPYAYGAPAPPYYPPPYAYGAPTPYYYDPQAYAAQVPYYDPQTYAAQAQAPYYDPQAYAAQVPYYDPQAYADQAQGAYDPQQAYADQGQSAYASQAYAEQAQGAYYDPQAYAEQAQGAYDPQAYAEQAQGAYDPQAYAEQAQGAYDPQAYAEQAQGAYYDPQAYADQAQGAYDPQAYAEHAQGAYDPQAYAEHAQGAYDPQAYAEHAQGAYDPQAYAEQAQGAYDPQAYADQGQAPYYDPQAYAEQAQGAYDPQAYADQAQGAYDPQAYADQGQAPYYDPQAYAAQASEASVTEESHLVEEAAVPSGDQASGSPHTSYGHQAHGEQEPQARGLSAPKASSKPVAFVQSASEPSAVEFSSHAPSSLQELTQRFGIWLQEAAEDTSFANSYAPELAPTDAIESTPDSAHELTQRFGIWLREAAGDQGSTGQYGEQRAARQWSMQQPAAAGDAAQPPGEPPQEASGELDFSVDVEEPETLVQAEPASALETDSLEPVALPATPGSTPQADSLEPVALPAATPSPEPETDSIEPVALPAATPSPVLETDSLEPVALPAAAPAPEPETDSLEPVALPAATPGSTPQADSVEPVALPAATPSPEPEANTQEPVALPATTPDSAPAADSSEPIALPAAAPAPEPETDSMEPVALPAVASSPEPEADSLEPVALPAAAPAPEPETNSVEPVALPAAAPAPEPETDSLEPVALPAAASSPEPEADSLEPVALPAAAPAPESETDSVEPVALPAAAASPEPEADSLEPVALPAAAPAPEPETDSVEPVTLPAAAPMPEPETDSVESVALPAATPAPDNQDSLSFPSEEATTQRMGIQVQGLEEAQSASFPASEAVTQRLGIQIRELTGTEDDLAAYEEDGAAGFDEERVDADPLMDTSNWAEEMLGHEDQVTLRLPMPGGTNRSSDGSTPRFMEDTSNWAAEIIGSDSDLPALQKPEDEAPNLQPPPGLIHGLLQRFGLTESQGPSRRFYVYESIGWLIGTLFLITGCVYFALGSWEGMGPLTRLLVVFGLTASYSAVFSLVGNILGRYKSLQLAGRLLGTIGSAMAPLASIASSLADGTRLKGGPLALLAALLVGWSFAAARLARQPAEAFAAPARPIIQLALIVTTMVMGIAPYAARLGEAALWLNALPCAFFFVLSRQGRPSSNEALAFALGVPLYLLSLVTLRLHLALGDAGVDPAFSAYTPFLTFALTAGLGFRQLEPDRRLDPVALAIVAAQVLCLGIAVSGHAPALCLTAAALTWTTWSLARVAPTWRLWLYPTCGFAWLTFASIGQLIPPLTRVLLSSAGRLLGYAEGQLPFHYIALTAVPFVLGGIALARTLLARAELEPQESEPPSESRHVAEVLLRASAAASILFTLLAHMGADARPSFWTSTPLAIACIAAGLRMQRPYLSIVGAALTLVLPYSAARLHGPHAALTCGLLAVALVVPFLRSSLLARRAVGAAVGWQAVAGLLFGLVSSSPVSALAGMALAGAAGWLVASSFGHPLLLALAATGAASLMPRLVALVLPQLLPLALAMTALGLAGLGRRQGRMQQFGLGAIIYAAIAFFWSLASGAPYLGVVMLASAGALAFASNAFPVVQPLAVAVAGLGLLPPTGAFAPWPWMTPALAVALLIPFALAASLTAARRGRSASTTVAGLVTVLHLTLTLPAARGPQPYPLLLGAALVALASARSLSPSIAIAAATLLAGAEGLTHGPLQLVVLAMLVSAIAVLPVVRPRVSQLLAGEWYFAYAASLCALLLMGAACLMETGRTSGVLLVVAVLLPLVWTRASRQPELAAFSLLLPFLLESRLLVGRSSLPLWWPLLPLLALAVARIVAGQPAARALLFGTTDEALAQRLNVWMQGALVVKAVALELLALAFDAPTVPWGAGLAAASLALMPGDRVSVRMALTAALLLPCAPLHLAGAAGLLVVGFLTHHLPSQLWSFLRSPPDTWLRHVAAWSAVGLAAGGVWLEPTPSACLVLAAVLLVVTFLLSNRWFLTATVLAVALSSLGEVEGRPAFTWSLTAALTFPAVALGAALVAAACQVNRLQKALNAAAARLSPGLRGRWSVQLWVGGMSIATVALAVQWAQGGASMLPTSMALLTGLSALALTVSRKPWMSYAAMVLLAAVLAAPLPAGWTVVAVSSAGLVLCWAGSVLTMRQVDAGRALYRGGWLLSMLALLDLPGLRHVGTPLSFALFAGSTWAVVYRRRQRELAGWLMTLVAIHVSLVHLQLVHSTDRYLPTPFLYFGAGTALLAVAALHLSGQSRRRLVSFSLIALCFVELAAGMVEASQVLTEVRGDVLVGGALGLLMGALVYRAWREKDEAAAFLAQAVLAVGHVAVRRLQGVGWSELGMVDSLAALAAGFLFCTLYLLGPRAGDEMLALRRPALLGTILFPLAGLLTAPWSIPLYVSALLMGYAAALALLALHPSQRTPASLASAVAFNSALLVAWVNHVGKPQHYLILLGLSLLVLLRVFEHRLEPELRSRLRAPLATFVCMAAAWDPLLQGGQGLLLSMAVCLAGVGAGVSLRVRSYAYLGSIFLVACVLVSLASFSLRDMKSGALFFSVLGLAVVGFMVLLTARREQLLQQYERVRSALSTWEA